MKVKEMFEEIKDIFKSEGVQVETEEVKEVKETTEAVKETKKEKFEDVVMKNGDVAQIEPEVIIGAAVVVIVDEELVPAPDGDWELSDGRIITTEDSIIVEIVEVETEPEEIAEAEDEERDVEEVDEELDKGLLTEGQQKQAKKIIESIITERVFTKEEITTEFNEKFSDRMKKLEKSFESLLKLVEFLVSEPTKKKINKAKNGFSNLKPKKTMDILEKLKKLNK